MRERPILFSAEMVRALLDGHKSQTRRVIHTDKLRSIYLWSDRSRWFDFDSWLRRFAHEKNCPYGIPGDRLWVRETFALVPATAYRCSEGVQQTINPTDPSEAAIYRAGWVRSEPYWRPSIFLPRWASRILLEITDVRVERVQEMPCADVEREGIGSWTIARGCLSETPPDPRWAFIDLWDKINAKRGDGWDQNPWCWVLGFRRID